MKNSSAFGIDYELTFDDGEVADVAVELHDVTLALLNRPHREPPAWTALNTAQCAVCCLDGNRERHCPVAVNLADLIEKFSRRFSYDHVRLRVTTQERVVLGDTTLQAALSSLMGIFMVTSGCPTMDKLRPMVRFHLPLATEAETVFRATSMFLVAQYLRSREGLAPDWTTNGLDEIYRDVHQVNCAFAKRIRQAAPTDANANALVRLDLFTDDVSQSTRQSLGDLRYLFAANYLAPAGEGARP